MIGWERWKPEPLAGGAARTVRLPIALRTRARRYQRGQDQTATHRNAERIQRARQVCGRRAGRLLC